MLAVYHHYQGSNSTQGMCVSWPWLGIWSSPVSSTSYNWLVTTQLQYGRKSDDNRNYTLLWEIQAGSACCVSWTGIFSTVELCDLQHYSWPLTALSMSLIVSSLYKSNMKSILILSEHSWSIPLKMLDETSTKVLWSPLVFWTGAMAWWSWYSDCFR